MISKISVTYKIEKDEDWNVFFPEEKELSVAIDENSNMLIFRDDEVTRIYASGIWLHVTIYRTDSEGV